MLTPEHIPVAFTPEKTAQHLYALHSELAARTTTPHPVNSTDKIIEIYERFGMEGAVTGLLAAAFDYTRCIARKPQPWSRHAPLPQGLLARASVAMAHNTSSPDFAEAAPDGGTCFREELFLARSLRSQYTDENASPAAVLFDTSGSPFAYWQPGDNSSAYAWRKAIYHTQSRDLRIPGSCFFQPDYGEQPDPRLDARYAGQKLANLHGAPAPVSARLLRFSSHLVPYPLAYIAHNHTGRTLPREELLSVEDLADSLRLSPRTIGQRACALLGQS